MTGTTQNWKQAYTFDRYGNRNFDVANTTTLPQNFNSNITNPTIDTANNRFTTGQGYTYDLSGNLITDAENRSFVYDAENKQKSAATTSSTIGQYFYDGDGKRIKKYVPATGETTIFVYDVGGKMVAEYSTVAPTNAQISYLTNDHLGSPRIITNELGKPTSRRDFMPFGEEIYSAQRTSGLNYAADNIREKFATYERDTETDLDFAQARYFDSGFGRFSSPDPYNVIFEKERGRNNREKLQIFTDFVLQPQNWNRYVYVLNNPINLTDPFGLIWLNKEGSDTYIWVDDAEYEKNKDLYKGYNNANGKIITATGGSMIGSDLKGKQVILDASGQIFEVTDEDIELGTVHIGDEPLEISTQPSNVSKGIFDRFISYHAYELVSETDVGGRYGFGVTEFEPTCFGPCTFRPRFAADKLLPGNSPTFMQCRNIRIFGYCETDYTFVCTGISTREDGVCSPLDR